MNRPYQLFATLTCIALVFCSCGKSSIAPTDLDVVDAGSGWFEAKTRKGGFQVAFPVKPKITTNIVDVVHGQIEQYFIFVEPRGTIAFGVMYHSAPQGSHAAILQSAGTAAVRDAKVISERDVSLGNTLGREIVMEKMAGQALLTMRIYVANNTVYLVSVVVPAQKPFKEQTDQFLNSFVILE